MSYLEDSELQLSSGSQIIRKVLSPAVGLWLRSQVESVAALKFQIDGSDRQILRGCVASVSVTAQQVVYQGLHLSHLDLKASQIRVNLGQVVRGKPLRLLEVVPVDATVQLKQIDLEASLSAPLLKQALVDLLKLILEQVDCSQIPELAVLQTQSVQLNSAQILLQANKLSLSAEVNDASSQCWQMHLQTALRLLGPSRLELADLKLSSTLGEQATSLLPMQSLEIDLGSEVQLQQLKIEPEQIVCIGQINVVPEN